MHLDKKQQIILPVHNIIIAENWWWQYNACLSKLKWQDYCTHPIFHSLGIVNNMLCLLTHWGRVTHICVGNLTIIGSDNGLSPGQRQVFIWTNAGILLIGPLGTNFNEILIEIHTFSFKKMHLKTLSAKWRPFCLDLNVLISTLSLEQNRWHAAHNRFHCLWLNESDWIGI